MARPANRPASGRPELTLDLASVPLAAAAGALGIFSPCVWPLIPVVMSSAATAGRSGPWLLTAGLALSFAFAGTLLSFLLVSAGLDPELFRYFSGGLLGLIGLVLLWPSLGDRVNGALSAVVARVGRASASSPSSSRSAWGQLGVGGLLGLVWLPCVGPTLGAAIGLASMGRSLPLAFVTMLAYGLGTGAVLLAAGLSSRQVLARWRPAVLAHANSGRRLLGGLLLLLGILVVTGLDKRLEALGVAFVPEWALSF